MVTGLEATPRGWWRRRATRRVLTPTCRQCGGHATVNVIRLGARRARYSCQRCGAVVTLGNLGRLAPSTGATATAGTATAARDDAVLARVMPAPMIRWARQRSRRPLTLDRLDKSTIYQLYRRWDGHLIEVGVTGAAALADGPEVAPVPGLPALSAVVGALHDHCYQVDPVVRAWRVPPPDAPVPDPAWAAALRQRVEHARYWLGSRGRSLCWIVSRLPAGALAEPDPDLVESAREALAAGRNPEPEAARAARAALFGTDGGPGLALLRQIYPADQMVAALTRYLVTGDRPLRQEVLERLDPDEPSQRPGVTG